MGGSGHGKIKGEYGFRDMSNERTYVVKSNSSFMDHGVKYASYRGNRLSTLKGLIYTTQIYPETVLYYMGIIGFIGLIVLAFFLGFLALHLPHLN